MGDPDFMTMAEWARENKRRGGVVIRPHYPYSGYTEDPVLVLKGLVDALEIWGLGGDGLGVQDWYGYLNCGYRVALAGGTDKMGAGCAMGGMRAYARIDADRPFDYDNWADAVRAGRTFSTSGPLIDIAAGGYNIGDTIELPPSGGTIDVIARAESTAPLAKIEIVHNGVVVATERAPKGATELCAAAKLSVSGSGWIAARCSTRATRTAGPAPAHTSPVYIQCGDSRPFDAPAAQHMLALVEGGMEYLQTLSTPFDEASRDRMLTMFREARQELMHRLVTEGNRQLHHGDGLYHTHHGR